MNVSFHTPWQRVDRKGCCPTCRAESEELFVVQTGDDVIWAHCRGCGWRSRKHQHVGREPTPVSVLVHGTDIDLTADGDIIVDTVELGAHESYRSPGHDESIGRQSNADRGEERSVGGGENKPQSVWGSLRAKVSGLFTP